MTCIHANTKREDFLKFLYYALRDANMPAQVLDCVDELQSMADGEEALAQEKVAREEVEEAASDLYEELALLADAVGDALGTEDTFSPEDMRLTFEDVLRAARHALERHKDLK